MGTCQLVVGAAVMLERRGGGVFYSAVARERVGGELGGHDAEVEGISSPIRLPR